MTKNYEFYILRYSMKYVLIVIVEKKFKLLSVQTSALWYYELIAN